MAKGVSWWIEQPREGFSSLCRREFALRPPEERKRTEIDDLEELTKSILSMLEAEEPEA